MFFFKKKKKALCVSHSIKKYLLKNFFFIKKTILEKNFFSHQIASQKDTGEMII